MIGLPGDNGRPILRAYSIASPSWDEEVEFYSIKVPDGPLTSKLQKIEVGDQVIMKTKPVGTLVVDALLPGKRLWMLATGTGIAPFASLVRDPEVYEKYDQVILTHTCREVAELTYGQELIDNLVCAIIHPLRAGLGQDAFQQTVLLFHRLQHVVVLGLDALGRLLQLVHYRVVEHADLTNFGER